MAVVNNLFSFKSREQIDLDAAEQELREAKNGMTLLSGMPIVDAEKLKRLITAQAKVTKIKKAIFEREKRNEILH
jgi:hypothetical protein